jgi:hypothetical protein
MASLTQKHHVILVLLLAASWANIMGTSGSFSRAPNNNELKKNINRLFKEI